MPLLAFCMFQETAMPVMKWDLNVIKNPAAVGFYLVAFVCMIIEWCLFKSELDIEYSSFVGTLTKSVGDVAAMLVFYWLLSPRWRWTLLVVAWGYSVWDVVNLAYFRFWGDLVPVSVFSMAGNVDGNLMSYGFSLLKIQDLIFVLAPAVENVAYFIMRPQKNGPFSVRFKLISVLLSLAVALIGQFSYFRTASAWNSSVSPQSLTENLNRHFLGDNIGQRRMYVLNGSACYGIRFCAEAVKLMTATIELNADQRSEISRFIENYSHADLPSDAKSRLDSLNVVYVIVESLNADMLGKEIGGLRVMPVLDSLAIGRGTVLFDNVVSQIKASSSSDGHLLLMTGLLPPDKVAYSITYGSTNTFPSLADVMPHHNKYLLLADDGVCWNEGNNMQNFGLGIPVTSKDRPVQNIENHGRDGAMFIQASEMMDTVSKPFFMTLMTISMHIPFREQGWPVPEEFENANGLSRTEKDYAAVCHFTDMYLGRFLKTIPDKTIVFIASDHSQGVASNYDSSPAAVFMAVGTDHTEHISRVVGQVNLFPATLDILGVGTMTYRGIAPSAFDSSIEGTRDAYGNIYGNPTKETLDTLDEAFRISDLILRGNYFNLQ